MDLAIDPSLESQDAPRRTKSGRPSKARGTVPGSAADFRRREANRLAADRSRSRQAEKHSALDNAARVLQEENTRLKEQILALESAGAVAASEEYSHVEHESEEPVAGPSRTAEIEHHDDEAQDDQEAHSHTILAALTDITGVDFSEGNEANWMQGMESFLKDSTESGRLGELAAVATGGEDNEAHPVNEKTGVSYPLPGQVAPNPAIILAAALNTEIECLVMEDLAFTKAAIVRIEHQISSLAGNHGLRHADNARDIVGDLLPDALYADDAELMEQTNDNLVHTIADLEAALPGVRDDFIKAREEKAGEERRIAELVQEIKNLGTANAEDKAKVDVALRSIGGYVVNILDEQENQQQTTYSPALARRRRGRPPKSDISRTFYQSFLIPPHSSSGLDERGKARLLRGLRKSSYLSQTITITERSSQQFEGSNEEPRTLDAAEQSDKAQEETTAEAVNRAEAYILSQLDSQLPPHSPHEHPEHREGEDMRLESESFVDFLPPQDEAPSSSAGNTDNVYPPPMSTPMARHASLQASASPLAPSVLSRLRQGPPGSCDICTRTETTVWRKLTLGGVDYKVCNACGLYHSKFGVIRPPELWGDGKSLKKRRTTVRAEGEDYSRKRPKRQDGPHEHDALDTEEGNVYESDLRDMGSEVKVGVQEERLDDPAISYGAQEGLEQGMGVMDEFLPLGDQVDELESDAGAGAEHPGELEDGIDEAFTAEGM
ncbi:hypothetical protein L198_04826 [Cryptococcus wingfieldii CBS 7118]|uniref:GATA-type domain-containing protein n=1 Tax=Cryptococcus wingfieldii CBS 7118 TaxID=1295528 RepID=A0A1E3J1Z9_9TREE|nr:hypothetical protein L198_04826 [Cryptococcus wingfieldii CBS 7118]ODN94685.1 hypothetical protein L198_04826 [Cryptococcus wingfieldii CBS 7118]